MTRRSHVYFHIQNQEQLRAERTALKWHIYSVEDRFRRRGTGLRNSLVSETPSKFLQWALLGLPTAITFFKAVSGLIRRPARRSRR